jgi:hypothetical protein
MLEGSCGLRFPIKTLQQRRAIRHIGGNRLQRDQPVDDGITGLVDHAHGASAQFVEDLVFAQFLQLTPLLGNAKRCRAEAFGFGIFGMKNGEEESPTKTLKPTYGQSRRFF